MTERPFVDLYEVLQLSPNANAETVERVYRLLAKRYHPDNQTTGDASTFAQVHEAYEILADPHRRAEYDVHYDENRRLQWKIFDQASATDGREQDRRIFHGILSLLYVARRRDPHAGGLGAVNLERLLGITQQDLRVRALVHAPAPVARPCSTPGSSPSRSRALTSWARRDLALPEDRLLPAASTTVHVSDPQPVSSTSVEQRGGVFDARRTNRRHWQR